MPHNLPPRSMDAFTFDIPSFAVQVYGTFTNEHRLHTIVVLLVYSRPGTARSDQLTASIWPFFVGLCVSIESSWSDQRALEKKERRLKCLVAAIATGGRCLHAPCVQSAILSTPDCQKVVSSIFGQIELRGVYGHSDLSASVAVHIMPRNPPQVPFFPFFRKGRKLHAPFL